MTNQQLQATALMVKDLKKSMRVTVVHHLFGMPYSIVDDVASHSVTITNVIPGEGNFTGFIDEQQPHTLVTMTFAECGIPDNPDGWSADVCTIPSADAEILQNNFIDATRERPLNRQLVATGQKTIPLLGK